MKIKKIKLAALFASLILSVVGANAQEVDTNATTVAYWKLSALSTIPENTVSGVGIPDLATNVGQGTLANTNIVPASVQNLWFEGPLAAGPTFTNDVPPASMFNANHYFNAGTGSWDCGLDQYPSAQGSLICDDATYGSSFNGPDFTWECYFKSDTTNDPVQGTTTQCILFDHHTSAYAFIYLNDSADTNSGGSTANIGSLRFWGWNVSVFGIDCRITAAQNYGHRLDDGHWHYVAARFNTATETMNMLVANDDGTSTETSTFITVPLNPGGAGSLFIGTDENENIPFNGKINQLRYSNVSLPYGQLIANASACNPPVFNNSPSTNILAVGTAVNLSAASWPLQVLGGPLEHQWQLNNSNIIGQTNLNLFIGSATPASAGTYQEIASTPCGGLSATSAPVVVQIVQAINIARWSMESSEAISNNAGQANWNGVYDSDSSGEGLHAIIDINPLPNAQPPGSGYLALTNDVPPTSMFINGNNGGTNSYDVSSTVGVYGALFYPQDLFGDVFDFQTSFSVELFFKTLGDQSGAGKMQLVAQGQDTGNFRYGVDVNETGPGSVTFAVETPSGGNYQTVSLTNTNYADGNWHYVLAQYDSAANRIMVTVANTNGTATTGTNALPFGFSPLFAMDTGNLFIGRYNFGWASPATPTDDPRNLLGFIDEVQISAGLVTPSSGQLGYIPGVVSPHITSISVSGGFVTIKFTGSASDPASAFTLVGSSTVSGTYSTLSATVISLGSGDFRATIATSGSKEFYRIKR